MQLNPINRQYTNNENDTYQFEPLVRPFWVKCVGNDRRDTHFIIIDKDFTVRV